MTKPTLKLPRHPRHEAAFKTALSRLRRTWEREERSIVGPEAIAEYLNTMIGLRDGKRPISRAMVSYWHKSRGLPLITIHRPYSTTNLMLLAWLWTYCDYQKTRRDGRALAKRKALPAPETIL